jgi:hypothetical protein
MIHQDIPAAFGGLCHTGIEARFCSGPGSPRANFRIDTRCFWYLQGHLFAPDGYQFVSFPGLPGISGQILERLRLKHLPTSLDLGKYRLVPVARDSGNTISRA